MAHDYVFSLVPSGIVEYPSQTKQTMGMSVLEKTFNPFFM